MNDWITAKTNEEIFEVYEALDISGTWMGGNELELWIKIDQHKGFDPSKVKFTLAGKELKVSADSGMEQTNGDKVYEVIGVKMNDQELINEIVERENIKDGYTPAMVEVIHLLKEVLAKLEAKNE